MLHIILLSLIITTVFFLCVVTSRLMRRVQKLNEEVKVSNRALKMELTEQIDNLEKASDQVKARVDQLQIDLKASKLPLQNNNKRKK